MRASSIDQDLCRKIAKRCIRVLVVACITLLVAAFVPGRAICQERLKVIYSQFTMTNSATWFAREAGLFERQRFDRRSGLRRFCSSGASTNGGSGTRSDDVRRIGCRALPERPGHSHACRLV